MSNIRKAIPIFLLMVSAVMANNEVREIDETVSEAKFKVRVMDKEFKEFNDEIIIKGVVRGKIDYNGAPNPNAYTDHRRCDFFAKGEFNSLFHSENKKLLARDLHFAKRYIDNIEETENQLKAFSRINTASDLPCGKLIFKIENYINKWQTRRASKVSENAIGFALKEVVSPRDNLFFVYPKFEMNVELSNLVDTHIINSVYRRVLGRQADDYELSVAINEKYDENWGYVLQENLVDEFEVINSSILDEKTSLLVDKSILLDDNLEEFWITNCLNADLDYELSNRKLCKVTDELMITPQTDFSCGLSDAVNILMSGYTPSTGEKCQQLASSGYYGDYAKIQLSNINKQISGLRLLKSKTEALTHSTYNKALKLVKNDSGIYSRFLQNNERYLEVLNSISWEHELFYEGHNNVANELEERIREYISSRHHRVNRIIDPGWIDPARPYDSKEYGINFPRGL